MKPTGSFCNLRCDYCFYLEKHALYKGLPATHRMNDATMEKVIEDMFACSDTPTFIWHGGEPTLMGLDFFVKAVALQRYYAKGREYSNAIQTNGTLLDEEWARFLKNENFLVGVSLDGPEHVHNQYRKDLRGNGTFQQVFENAKMLSDKGVQVNVLATVNAYSVKYAEEIYKFFRKNRFTFMQFMPVVETDPRNPDAAAPYSVDAKDYGVFLNRLFNLWVKDFDFKRLRQKTSVRFFDALIQKYVGMVPDHCIFHKVCGDALVVEHNGDLFSCDYLVSEDTRVGNIHEMSIGEAFRSRDHLAFGRRKSDFGIECKECQWLDLCYGGCIKDRIRDPKDKGHNHFCESYKFFFERADKRLRKFAKLYRDHYQN
ncbi:anaerobic sulfatase maturase [Desulfonema magnum]|uniref:anaerobic sulfatase maturase n=1 Tax=Desulfonema magnum TaxID=45655 RepID=UPI001FE25C54|nr:anaerobic sulfatase maturase [Desulfonema magnum]